MCKSQTERENVAIKLREAKGCWGYRDRAVWVYMREILFFKCPSNFFSNTFYSIMRMYNKNKEHIFNTCLDQPAKLVETYEILDNLFSEYNQREARKHGK